MELITTASAPAPADQSNDEEALAEALVAVRRVTDCPSLSSGARQAAFAFAELLELYVSKPALRVHGGEES